MMKCDWQSLPTIEEQIFVCIGGIVTTSVKFDKVNTMDKPASRHRKCGENCLAYGILGFDDEGYVEVLHLGATKNLPWKACDGFELMPDDEVSKLQLEYLLMFMYKAERSGYLIQEMGVTVTGDGMTRAVPI